MTFKDIKDPREMKIRELYPLAMALASAIDGCDSVSEACISKGISIEVPHWAMEKYVHDLSAKTDLVPINLIEASLCIRRNIHVFMRQEYFSVPDMDNDPEYRSLVRRGGLRHLETLIIAHL